jgi:predicted ATPase
MHLNTVTIHSDTFPLDDVFPFNLPQLTAGPTLCLTRPVSFFVGENGSGKTTLLEAIARRCGIHMWQQPPRHHRVHDNPYEARLHEHLSVGWTNGKVTGAIFRAENFFHFAEFIDDVAMSDPGQLKYYGGAVFNTLSHGQGILAYLGGRFRIPGLYFLDEPEAALSPASQVEFLRLLRGFEEEGHAQFIIATHSPILLAHPGAQIVSFDGPQLADVGYEETAHYRLYKDFLSDPDAFLRDG